MIFLDTIASGENLPAAMRFVREASGEAGVCEEVLIRVDLVVEEIFLNIASHACPGEPVRLGCAATNEEVTLEFHYSGPEFDPRIEPERKPDVPLAERAIGGLGLLLIGKMTGSIEYAHQAGRNRLEARVPARDIRTRTATQD